jgi:hypothetical protein
MFATDRCIFCVEPSILHHCENIVLWCHFHLSPYMCIAWVVKILCSIFFFFFSFAWKHIYVGFICSNFLSFILSSFFNSFIHSFIHSFIPSYVTLKSYIGLFSLSLCCFVLSFVTAYEAVLYLLHFVHLVACNIIIPSLSVLLLANFPPWMNNVN